MRGQYTTGEFIATQAAVAKAKREREAKRATPPPYDVMGNIIAYESGLLSDIDTIALFQHLINNGHAWQLQGSYGRAAAALIEQGYCQPAAPKGVKR
jgi:hypothetical protein